VQTCSCSIVSIDFAYSKTKIVILKDDISKPTSSSGTTSQEKAERFKPEKDETTSNDKADAEETSIKSLTAGGPESTADTHVDAEREQTFQGTGGKIFMKEY